MLLMGKIRWLIGKGAGHRSQTVDSGTHGTVLHVVPYLDADTRQQRRFHLPAVVEDAAISGLQFGLNQGTLLFREGTAL